jgi:hypothetical protein
MGDSLRRTGGGGRPSVLIPVRFVRYGRGGGAGASSSCSSVCCGGWEISPRPRRGGVGVVLGDTPAGAPGPTRFGGGPKDDGSLSDVKGRETCSARSSAFGSLPFPTQPA